MYPAKISDGGSSFLASVSFFSTCRQEEHEKRRSEQINK
jgi:hypothetical protein